MVPHFRFLLDSCDVVINVNLVLDWKLHSYSVHWDKLLADILLPGAGFRANKDGAGSYT